jgi:RimJ/RimL family protein N-acetyltransferase
MPWCHPAYSQHESQSWIRATIEGHATGTMFDFAVFDAQGRYAGACGINQIQSAYRCANLGFWIRTSACGHGLASTAARRVCQWAFANTSLNRLEILMAVSNVPSQRVALKLNAHYEGRLRSRLLLTNGPSDAFVYSIVRGDFEHTTPAVQAMSP